MTRLWLLVVAMAMSCAAGCREDAGSGSTPHAAQSAPAATASSSASASLNPTAGEPKPLAEQVLAPAMRDDALGDLTNSLSEPTGDFPSDNFVSNETSYLHVAPALLDPHLRGRAYVGVGPEQNLTYIAMMRPAMAYVVDIRRQNMLEHLVLRALIETSRHRATFLARLTARDLGSCGLAQPELASVDQIADALERVKASKVRWEREVQHVLAVQARLGVRRMPGDDKRIRSVLQAFARYGLGLTYTMHNSGRRYPKLRTLLAMQGPDGKQRSFVADEDAYQAVRAMLRANRVVPVVGDFAGDHALRGVARDMGERGLLLGVFYTSNVEQYLFEGGVYGKFVRNVKGLPADDRSLIVRVWFDQGRAHTRQQQGHRTTSLTTPVREVLADWEQKPYRSYWEAVTRE
jgi:hypothetical protein